MKTSERSRNIAKLRLTQNTHFKATGKTNTEHWGLLLTQSGVSGVWASTFRQTRNNPRVGRVSPVSRNVEAGVTEELNEKDKLTSSLSLAVLNEGPWVLFPETVLCRSSSYCSERQWCTFIPNSNHTGSLQSVSVGIFIPQKLANATNQGLLVCPSGGPIVKHLPAYYCTRVTP